MPLLETLLQRERRSPSGGRKWLLPFINSFLYLRIKYPAMKRFFILTIILLFAIILKAQEQPIPYSQADRDRMVRVETKVESLDKRIDDVQMQINRMGDKFDSYFMWGFGLVLMSIFGLIGFIIYDRRTTLAPVENKTERILKVLKEAAEKDPVLREALKKMALW
jgi:hypothetical protein